MRGLNLLALPHHGKVYQTKHKLRRRAEGRFHYTQVRQGWVCHYSSDEPQVARPEWLLDQLIASEVVAIDESLVIVEALEFDNTYLCVVIEQGVVTQAWLQNEPNWTSLLVMNTERRLLIGNVPGLEGKAYQLDNNFADRLAQYQLKAPSRFGLSIAVVTALMAIVVMVGKLWLSNAPIEESHTAQVIEKEQYSPSLSSTPWAQYRLALFNASSAEQSFQSTVYLATYLSMLPQGWVADVVHYEGSSIRTQLKRQPNGLVSVIDAWVDKHSEMKRIVTTESGAYTFNIPVTVGMPQWYNMNMPINPSGQNLQDTLTLMGFSLIERHEESHADTWQSLSWKASKADASLGELAALNSILIQLPVSVSDIKLTHRADDIWETHFTMTLYGGL